MIELLAMFMDQIHRAGRNRASRFTAARSARQRIIWRRLLSYPADRLILARRDLPALRTATWTGRPRWRSSASSRGGAGHHLAGRLHALAQFARQQQDPAREGYAQEAFP